MYKKITTIEEYSAEPAIGSPLCNKKYSPCIRVDAPLLIRLLEYAREDASSDLDLHFLASEMIKRIEAGRVLTMTDYESLIAPPVVAEPE